MWTRDRLDKDGAIFGGRKGIKAQPNIESAFASRRPSSRVGIKMALSLALALLASTAGFALAAPAHHSSHTTPDLQGVDSSARPRLAAWFSRDCCVSDADCDVGFPINPHLSLLHLLVELDAFRSSSA